MLKPYFQYLLSLQAISGTVLSHLKFQGNAQLSKEYLHRYCPICRIQTHSNLEVYSQIKAEDIRYENLVQYWNGFFKKKIFFSYARCNECHLLFAPIFYKPTQLQELYEQMPPNMDVVPMSALLKTQKVYFQELKRRSPLLNGYVEIGPDIGLFLINCVSEGRFDHYWLCEPNKAVAAQLAKVMAGRKHIITEDMFSFSVIPDRSIGVAVMIQVLDHLLDPILTLTELRAKLLEDGKLLLVTHNEGSLLRKLIGWRWPAFCLQHPQIYNPQSIAKLLEASGFYVESIKRSKNYFEFSFLLKHLFWAFGIKINSIPKIFNFTIGIRLGNIITIACPIKK